MGGGVMDALETLEFLRKRAETAEAERDEARRMAVELGDSLRVFLDTRQVVGRAHVVRCYPPDGWRTTIERWREELG
jgi:hypothetical protein